MNELQPSSKSLSSRRGVLSWALMAASLVASYGVGLAYAFRFLWPVNRERWRELFVATLDEIPPGTHRKFIDPAGGETFVHNLAGQFLALSSVCPHLGCKVHYHAAEQRFVCPCHQGMFDSTGQPLSGPPKQENKALKRQEVIVRTGAVYLRWRQT